MKQENTVTQDENESVESKNEKGKSAYDKDFGRVRITVWKNFSRNTGKHYHKVSIRRVNKDKDGRDHLENSFWPEDLKDLATAATAGKIWLEDNTDEFERQREWKREKMRGSKGPKARKTQSANPEE